MDNRKLASVPAPFTVDYSRRRRHHARSGHASLANLGGWLNLIPVGRSDGIHVLRHLAALKTAA
jgi:hypothetical protein